MVDFRAVPESTHEILDVFDETGGPASTDTAHLKVNDNNTGTYVRQSLATDSDSNLLLGVATSVEYPIASIDTLDVRARVNILGGWTNDTLELKVQIFQSDRSTPLTDELTLATAGAGPDQIPENTWSIVDKSFAVLSNDPLDWVGQVCRFYWVYSRSQSADGAYIAIAEIDMPGTLTRVAVDLTAGDLASSSTVQQWNMLEYFRVTVESVQFATDTGDLVARLLYGHPSIQSKAITQDHVLGADNIYQRGSIQSAALLTEGALGVLPLYSDPEIQSGAVVHAHYLAAADLYGHPSVQSVTLTSDTELAASGLQSSGTVQSKVIGLEGDLLVLGLFGHPTIQSVVISQSHDTLDALDLYQHPTIQSTRVDQFGSLVSLDLYQHPSIQSGRVDQFGVLTALDLYGHPTVQSVDLDVDSNLSAGDVSSSAEVQSGVILTEHYLEAEGLQSESSIQSVWLTQDHDLLAADLQSASSIGDVALYLGMLAVSCPTIRDKSTTYNIRTIC
jgi:hypothetical protein